MKYHLAVVALLGLAVVLGAAAALEPATSVAFALALLLMLAARQMRRRARSQPWTVFAVAVLLVVAAQEMTISRRLWVPGLALAREARLPITLLVLGLLAMARPTALFGRRAVSAWAAPIAWVAWLAIGGLLAVDPFNSFFYATWLALIVLIAAQLVTWHPEPSTLWVAFARTDRWIGLALVSLSLLAIGLGLDQAAGVRYVGGQKAIGYQGLFDNPNMLGYVSCQTAGYFLALRYWSPETTRTRDWLIPTSICAVGAVASTSRAAILAMGCAAALVLWREFADTRSARARLIRGALIGVAVLVVFRLLLETDIGSTALTRLGGTLDAGSRARDDRLVIWSSFLRLWVERPWVGIGYANTLDHFDYEAMRTLEGHLDPHSTVIALLFTSGILGTVLGLIWVRGVIVGARRPAASRFNRSASTFLICTLPYYLAETTASGPGSPASWPTWILVLTYLAYRTPSQVASPHLLPLSQPAAIPGPSP